MRKKLKVKKYIVGAFVFLLTTLTGCKIKTVVNQGYTFKVTYDLGEGVVTNNERYAHTLTLMYQPGSYLSDFSTTQLEFKILSQDDTKYELEGWYFDKEFNNPVNFDEYTLPTTENGELYLYAKWEEILDKFFNISYYDVSVGEFSNQKNELKWDINKAFNFAESSIAYPSEETYTYIGAFKDEEMSIPVDNNYLLTKESENLPIYTKWIKGRYSIVRTARDFTNYFSSGYALNNFYLDANIDLGGRVVTFPATLTGKTILGNNFVVSNFMYSTKANIGTSKTTVTLGGIADSAENCTIKDLTFTDVTYEMEALVCSYLNFNPLFGTAKNCQVENVSITGKLVYEEKTKKRMNDEIKPLIVRISTDKIGYTIDDLSIVSNLNINITKEEL